MNAFKCPKCDKTTSGKEKFCMDCGQPLNITCPNCGETWRFMFEYKFCPACGHNMKKENHKGGQKQ
jgi:predicted amidophosphoribosyltransferase